MIWDDNSKNNDFTEKVLDDGVVENDNNQSQENVEEQLDENTNDKKTNDKQEESTQSNDDNKFNMENLIKDMIKGKDNEIDKLKNQNSKIIRLIKEKELITQKTNDNILFVENKKNILNIIKLKNLLIIAMKEFTKLFESVDEDNSLYLNLKSVYHGFKMVLLMYDNVLEENDIIQLSKTDIVFDEEYHQVVKTEVTTNESEDKKVIDVIEDGYKYKSNNKVFQMSKVIILKFEK